MNLATARASQRAHEVGVRKAIGAERRSLIISIPDESMGVSLIALVLAWALAAGWTGFNSITSKSMVPLDERTILVPDHPAIYRRSPVAIPRCIFLHSTRSRVLKGKSNLPGVKFFARKGSRLFSIRTQHRF